MAARPCFRRNAERPGGRRGRSRRVALRHQVPLRRPVVLLHRHPQPHPVHRQPRGLRPLRRRGPLARHGPRSEAWTWDSARRRKPSARSFRPSWPPSATAGSSATSKRATSATPLTCGAPWPTGAGSASSSPSATAEAGAPGPTSSSSWRKSDANPAPSPTRRASCKAAWRFLSWGRRRRKLNTSPASSTAPCSSASASPSPAPPTTPAASRFAPSPAARTGRSTAPSSSSSTAHPPTTTSSSREPATPKTPPTASPSSSSTPLRPASASRRSLPWPKTSRPRSSSTRRWSPGRGSSAPSTAPGPPFAKSSTSPPSPSAPRCPADAGRPRLRRRVLQDTHTVRPAHWQLPGHPAPRRQHAHRDGRRPLQRLRGRLARRRGPSLRNTSMAKALCTEAYQNVTATGHQILGGVGFYKELDMQLWYRRAKSAEAFFGDAEYHRERIAQLMGL